MWVRLMDDLIDILKQQPAFVCFVLDGQAILVEDYVAVRPDQVDVIRELVRTGRLLIGPWYILPDDLLVSPEALVRNLLIGAEVSYAFGQRMDIGYLPGRYGHIGQLPQILAGFGISLAVAHVGHPSRFVVGEWASPDGSKTLLANLSGSEIDPTDLASSNKTAKFARLLKQRFEASPNGALLLTEGGAYASPSHIQPDLLANLREVSGRASISHGGLSEYFQEVGRSRKSSLPRLVGALSPPQSAGPSRSHGALIWIKQRNQQVETLLERCVEPFSAWATLLEKNESDLTSSMAPHRLDSPARMIDRAWHILLQNHAQPSIGGLADERVAEEVALRFNRAEQIGRKVLADSLDFLVSRVRTAANLPQDEQGPVILVFNAGPETQTSTVSFQLPDELLLDRIELCDTSGIPIPWDTHPSLAESPEVDQTYKVMRFNARDIPPIGYNTFFLRRTDYGNCESLMVDNGLAIENDYLSAEVDPFSGTLSLFDKTTGRSFSGLNHFVDGGDCGDIVSYRAPDQDTLIGIPTNTPLHVEREVSAVRQTLTFLQIYRLPQKLTPARDARLPLAAQFVPMSIMTTVHLTPGVPRLDFEVALTNNALDHRLQVCFPSGIAASEVIFDGHFELTRRGFLTTRGRAGRSSDHRSTFTHHQRDFVTVQGDDCGFTVANRGLPEVEVIAEDQGITLALTLLRSVGLSSANEPLPAFAGYSANHNLSPVSQCLGDFLFEYSLIPHGTHPTRAWQEARSYQTTPQAVITDQHEGTLPTSTSLIRADNTGFIISAVRQSKDGSVLIVRGYNSTSQPIVCHIGVGLPVRKAELLRLDETPLEVLQLADTTGDYRIEANPAQIVTLGFSIL